MEKNNNISWINYVRTFCMFFVYFLHTENRAHYVFLERNIDVFFSPFFINAFFIVSGYLLYRKQEQIHLKTKSIHIWYQRYGKEYLLNIVFKLIIPSILFSLVMFFPKMMIRHQEIELSALLMQTIGGGTMWFVSALAVAQFLIFILLFFRKFSLILWVVFGLFCFLISYLLHEFGFKNIPFYYQSGLSAVFFLSMGAFFYKVEKYVALKSVFLLMFFICYVLLIYNVKSFIALEYMKVNFQGVILCLMSSYILIFFCKKIKPNRIIEKIGRSTIGIYFLSGAVPECTSIIAKYFFDFNDAVFLAVVFISFIISIALNEILLKYAGFVFDLRKLVICKQNGKKMEFNESCENKKRER